MRIRNLPHRFALTLTAVVAAIAVASIGIAAPAEAAGKCVDYQYGYGGYSTCIGDIQQLLNWERIGLSSTYRHPTTDYVTLAVDNSFGSKTQKAVLAFQRYWGLSVDGLVGPQTWRYLCSPEMGPGIPPSFPLAAARNAGCNI